MTPRALAALHKRWREFGYTLAQPERTLVAEALRLAADQYAIDAKHNRAAVGGERVAEKFDQQAHDCREIAEAIEP